MNNIHEFNKPIPVVLENNEEGLALYVKDSGIFENDEWCVVHCNGGHVRHYLSHQIKIYKNNTFDISKEDITTLITTISNDMDLGRQIRAVYNTKKS